MAEHVGVPHESPRTEAECSEEVTVIIVRNFFEIGGERWYRYRGESSELRRETEVRTIRGSDRPTPLHSRFQ